MDITAVDLCDNNVTIVLTTQNNTGGCANSYAIIRTWTASDDCGNAVADSQTITILDTLPPVLFGIPADMTVDCDNIPAPPVNGPGGVTAVDNCDTSPNLLRVQSDNQDPDPTQCGHVNFEITRTWIATDDCGNVQTQSQTLSVRDTEAPLLFCPAADTFIVSTGTCLADGPLVRTKFISDNCSGGGTSLLTDTLPILNTSGTPLLSGVVDTVFFAFSFAGVPDQYVTGNIHLQINLFNADAEEPGEYYRIYTEDGTLLTQTNPVPAQCGNGVIPPPTRQKIGMIVLSPIAGAIGGEEGSSPPGRWSAEFFNHSKIDMIASLADADGRRISAFFGPDHAALHQVVDQQFVLQIRPRNHLENLTE